MEYRAEESFVPPHCVTTEKSLLGGIILASLQGEGVECFLKASEVITANDFYNKNNRDVFEAMAGIASKNQSADLVTLSDWMKEAGTLDDAGGFDYLTHLARSVSGFSNVGAYAEALKKKSLKRQLVAIGERIRTEAMKDDHTSADEIKSLAEGELYKLSSGNGSSRNYVTSGKEARKRVLTTIEERSKLSASVETLLGVSCGLDDLDKHLSGVRDSMLYVIGGRPKMGKTTLGCQIIDYQAFKGLPSIIFSMEMPADQLMVRTMSRQSGVPFAKLNESWKIEDADWAKLGNGISRHAKDPVYIVDKPGLTPSEIRSYTMRLSQKFKDEGYPQGVKRIMVDHVGLMSSDAGGSKGANRAEVVGAYSKGLKELAMEMNIGVLLLAQLGRQVDSRPDKRPMMSDLRESGSLEQDADVIVFVYRDEYYNPESADKGTAEIIIAGNRHGAPGFVRVVSKMDISSFLNYAPGYEDYDHV